MRVFRCSLAGLVVLAAAWPLSAQQFRSSVDLVRLPVVVTGKDGVLTRRLTANDFEVYEDGVRQVISAFAEGAPGSAVPLHLGLLLDTSASMELDLRDAANAAAQFVDSLDEADDVTLLDFDSRIRIGRFTRDSYNQLVERMRARKPDGNTALYDAIGIYLELANERAGQHVLIMYTDGGDSVSKLTVSQLLQTLRFSNVIVYAIGYVNHQSASTRLGQQSMLMSLARESGGDAFFPGTKRDLESAYRRILDEIASRYTIGYESTNRKTDGRFRKVSVRLAEPHARSSKVRTRSGYLAPKK